MGNVAAQLEVTALAMTATLAIWLGLSVLTRFPTMVARALALLALVLASWCGATIVERLSSSAAVISVGRVIEELGTGAVLPAMVGLALHVATEGTAALAASPAGTRLRPERRSRAPRGVDPGTYIPIGLPRLALGLDHAEDIDTARNVVRLATILTAIAMSLVAYRRGRGLAAGSGWDHAGGNDACRSRRLSEGL